MNYLYNLIKNKFPNQSIFPLNIYEYLNNYESFDIFEAFCALERSANIKDIAESQGDSEILNNEIVVWSQYSPNKKESLYLCEIDVGIDLISNNDYSYIGQCKNYSEKGYVCARHIERTLLCVHHSRYYLKNFDIFKTIEIISPLNVTLGRTKLNHKGEFNHILLDKIELSNKWMTKLNNTKFKEDFSKEKKESINDLQLRDCQKKVLDYIKENPHKKIIKISLPCGSGKTLIAIKWLSDVEKWLILVPSILLADQIFDYLINNKIFTKNQIGLCYDGKSVSKNINRIICVYNSFFKIKDRNFIKIFVDESHHILNKGINGKILNKERESYLDEIKNDLLNENKDRKILFMSATMRSPDFKYSLREAIEDKILVDYYVHIPIYTGNYEKSLIEYFKNRLYLYSILAFCNNIENAKKFSEMCVKEGLTSSWISGDMNQTKRKEILNKFQKGETRILVSVKVLGEGINIRCANTCAFVQPKHSYYQIIQNCGRIFRECEGKESAHIILPGVNQDDFEEGEEIDENSCKMYDFIKALGNEDYILKDSILKNSQRLIVDKIEPKKEDSNEVEDEEKNEKEDIGQIIREIIIKRIDEKYQKSFDAWCELIKEHIKEFNRLPLLSSTYLYKNEKIGTYMRYLRHKHNKGKLSQLYIDKLNSIDIRILQHFGFDEKIKLVEEYMKTNEKLLVSTKYKYYNIGYFVSNCRTKFRDGKLSQDKIDKLNSINFNLLNKKKKVILTFDEKIKVIEDYIEENPNKPIIYSTTYKDIKIGEYISRFRSSFRDEKLSQDEINILNKIDHKILDSPPTKVIFPFNESIKLVKEYIKIKKELPKNKTEYKGRKIGRFLEYYRLQYDNNKLSQDKIDIFNDIDEKILNPENNYVAPRPFEFYISLLKEYIEINKKIPIQTTVFKDINIGDFVSKQRKKFNDKKLDQEKIDIFNSIDNKILNTKSPKKSFEFYIPLIIEYIEINKKLPYRNTVFKDIHLGNFISKQKLKYKDGELEHEKIIILNNIDTKILTS